jgi:predicted DNA-binding protein (UPF0251 family)
MTPSPHHHRIVDRFLVDAEMPKPTRHTLTPSGPEFDLTRLPRRPAQAIVLTTVLGLTQAEAAEVLGVKRSAVYMARERGFALLRAQLGMSGDA